MPARNHFLTIEQLRESDRFIVFYHSDVLVRDQQFLWEFSQLSPQLIDGADLIVLEEGEESAIILVCSARDLSGDLKAEICSLRSLLFTEAGHRFSIVGKASQLVDWFISHRHCGCCGKATTPHPKDRAVVCEDCNKHYFPRINPCVIMLVVKGRQLLLARSARFKSGFFSCLAGFIEIGETPEQTVVREVKEEVGIDVVNIRYIKSQSWPFPSQLMLGFIADYKQGEIVPEVAEIAEAAWYDVDKLPNVPSPKISVAGELIQHFVKSCKEGMT